MIPLRAITDLLGNVSRLLPKAPLTLQTITWGDWKLHGRSPAR